MANKNSTPQVVVVRRRAAELDVRVTDGAHKHLLTRTDSDTAIRDAIILAADNMERAIAGKRRVPSTVNLWPVQHEIFGKFARFFRYAATVLQAGQLVDFAREEQPPRTGKTLNMGELVAATGIRALILVPGIDLIEQHREKLGAQLPTINIGVYYGLEKEIAYDGLTIATYDIIHDHYKRGKLPAALRNVPMILCDEGHGAMTDERMEMLKKAFHPSALRIAFTGTPDYDPDDPLRQLATYFPYLIHQMTMDDAMELKLYPDAEVWIKRIDHGSVEGFEITMMADDYSPKDIERITSSAPAFEECRRIIYETGAPRRGTLVTCVTRQQAKDLCTYLELTRPDGTPEPAIIIDQTKPQERKRLKAEFDAGERDVLLCVGVLLTGWDAKRCKRLVDLAITCSLVRATQKYLRPMTLDGDAKAEIYILAPIWLPRPPIFPAQLFGKIVQHEEKIRAPKPARGRKPQASNKPLELTKGVPRGVKVREEIMMAGGTFKPLLNPKDYDGIRAVIATGLDVMAAGHTPRYRLFRRKVFQHKLFTGRGIDLLRYCGISFVAYEPFMDALYSDRIASRFLRKIKLAAKERQTLNAVDLELIQLQQALDQALSYDAEPDTSTEMPGWAYGVTSAEAFTPEEQLIQRAAEARIWRLLDQLEPMERAAVVLHRGLEGEPTTFVSIGENGLLGQTYSHSWVKILYDRGLRTFAKMFFSHDDD